MDHEDKLVAAQVEIDEGVTLPTEEIVEKIAGRGEIEMEEETNSNLI